MGQMVRLAFAVACCALAVGTAAQAQISNVTGAATSNTTLAAKPAGNHGASSPPRTSSHQSKTNKPADAKIAAIR